MTPKEMTNEQLVHRSEDRGAYVMEHGQDVGLGVHNELLRRLNEADALRKENAVIRADNADLLAKQDAFVFVHNNMASDMDTLRKENDELASALRVCKTWFQMHGMQTFNHMECGIADDALSHRMSRLAKESEASHE